MGPNIIKDYLNMSFTNLILLSLNFFIKCLNNKDKSLDDLIDAVCRKGGTTIEAVKTYKECGLDEITLKAVNACIQRSKELENI